VSRTAGGPSGSLKDGPIARLLESLHLNIADVGARGGVDDALQAIAFACNVYAFEPDSEEANRLQKHPDLRWRSLTVVPSAVGAQDGVSTLHIPAAAEGASLLPHNLEMVERFGYDDLHVIRQTALVSTVTLDSLFSAGVLPRLDYLKIDVEGAELDILKAGRDALRSCAALKIECSFLQQRNGQALIWEVIPLVISGGLEVVDIAGFHRWRRRPVPAHPYRTNYEMPYSKGQVAQCDVMCLRAPKTVTSSDDLARLVIISSALGYFDFAIGAIRCQSSLAEVICRDYDIDLEAEIKRWSACAGRQASREALFLHLRDLIPHVRSVMGRLPFRQSLRPY
jgi:FkbM family methyltransferase